MYRFNGYLKGAKIANFTSATGVIKSAGEPRGRANGGYLGVNRTLSDNIDNNVDKTSGIWHMSMGLKLVENHPVDTTVDNSYYEAQPPEERFQETSSTYLGGGYTWNVAYIVSNCPGTVTWPQGDYGGHSASGYSGGLSRKWTAFGDQNNCIGWTFDVYGIQGYYYTYYPPPVYVEQIDIVTNYYTVWDFF